MPAYALHSETRGDATSDAAYHSFIRVKLADGTITKFDVWDIDAVIDVSREAAYTDASNTGGGSVVGFLALAGAVLGLIVGVAISGTSPADANSETASGCASTAVLTMYAGLGILIGAALGAIIGVIATGA